MSDGAVDAHALAARVRATRLHKSMNQTDLARAAGVSQATVSRIEKGDRPVTLAEADALALALDLPLDTLLHGSRVAGRVLVSLRVADAGVDRASAVRPAVALLELDERLDAVESNYRQTSRPVPVAVSTSGTPSTVGAKLAADLRTELQLGAAAITELAELIEEVTGVDVAAQSLPGISGGCLEDPQRMTRLLVVNSDEPAERQRFTLAHELGHLLFGDGAHVDSLDTAAHALSAQAQARETRCDEFARSFLLPRAGVTGWLHRNGYVATGPVPDQAVSLLARHFGVTNEVVKIQLERMRLRADHPIASTPALAARFGWRAEYEAGQAAARRPRPPRRLAQRATAAYARGLVGATVVANLQGRPVAEVEAERRLELAESPASPPGLVSLDNLLARAASQSQ